MGLTAFNRARREQAELDSADEQGEVIIPPESEIIPTESEIDSATVKPIRGKKSQ